MPLYSHCQIKKQNQQMGDAIQRLPAIDGGMVLFFCNKQVVARVTPVAQDLPVEAHLTSIQK